jgi:thioredoxin 1
MSSECAIHLSDSVFDQEVLRSEVPFLVDFWGDACPPCRQVAPVVESLACEYAGKLKVGKLDVGMNAASAMRYQVRSIPTLILFKGGQVVAQRVGAGGKSELARMIEAHL